MYCSRVYDPSAIQPCSTTIKSYSEADVTEKTSANF